MGCNRSLPKINALVQRYDKLDLYELRCDAKFRMDEQACADKERYAKGKAYIFPFKPGDIVFVEKNPRIIK